MTNWKPPEDDHRCTAKSKQSDRRCRRYRCVGQTVCYIHGGASPQAKAAADKKLALAADLAIEILAEEMEEGQSSRDRIRAAIAILDRAGFGALRRIELTPGAVRSEIERLRSELGVEGDIE